MQSLTHNQFRQLQLELSIEAMQTQEVEWDQVKEHSQELADLGHQYRQMRLNQD